MHHTNIIIDILILLAAAVISVPLFRRLRVGAVLGYLVAGMAIGPSALGLIGSVEDIRAIGDLGVVFLLFTVGLELKLARLWVMRRTVFGLGGAQIVLTAVPIALVAWALGLGPSGATVVGGALALSSTAIVLQLLNERGELTTRSGRVSFAILLMQDLAVVPLLAMVSMMGGGEEAIPAPLGLGGFEAVLALVAIVVGGRVLLRPLMRLIAASRNLEIFAAATVLVVLGTAWVTAQVGLSMALGAFLAGLLLAETEFRHQVESDIQPFRGFLLGLFFMTVGMTIDLRLAATEAPALLALISALIVIKAAVLFGLMRLIGHGTAVAVPVGLMLAQGGEFAFVLFSLARNEGLLSDQAVGLLTVAVAVSMMVTPLLAMLAGRVPGRYGRDAMPRPEQGEAEAKNHVIIAGFGRVGQTVGRMLEARGIPYTALDLHSERVAEASGRGLPVFYADAAQVEVLRTAGADKARAVVVTLDNAREAERCVATLRSSFPELKVFARARDRSHSRLLRDHGATMAVPETMEASLQLGATVLRAVGASEVNSLVDSFREDDYARLEPLISGNVERVGRR